MEERTIRITLRRHETTGQIAATSEDLRGLVIFGETVAEIADKLPRVIRELLEADGLVVSSVTAVEDDRFSRAGFGPPVFVASASLVKTNDGRRV